MPPKLLPLTEGPSLMLDKPILLIGRHQECDIQIPSRKVSRRHCCIAKVKDQLVVRDLCSTNGIRINGSRVQEGMLSAGDELTIGNFRYEVCWDDVPDVIIDEKSNHDAGAAKKPAAGLLSENDIAGMESCDEPMPINESLSPQSPSPLPSKKHTDLANDQQPPSGLIPDDLNLKSDNSGDAKPESNSDKNVGA